MGTDTATPTKENRMETNMNLVAFHDKELITDSEIVAQVFGKNHKDVLRSIYAIIQKNEELNDHERRSALMVEERLLKIEESSPQPEERRREFGEGAGKLISEPAQTPQPPTAHDMLLAKAYDETFERERNEIDSSKRQYFRRVDVVVDLGMGRSRLSHEYEMNRDGFFLLAMGFTGPKALEFKVQFIQEFNRLESAVLNQLKSDSQKLHLIEDRSRWQDMEWRLRTLEAEKREMSDRLTLLETKGKTVTKLQSDIRRGGFRDAANIFYPPVRTALRRLVTASSQSNVEKMRTAILYVIELLYKSMDKTVDVTNRYDLDLEATYDEEAVRDFDEKFATQYFGTSTL